HDVGTILNPLTHQGQIEGGVVQGIGQALSEHLLVQDGAVTTLHLGDYKLPTAMDIPELTTVLVESKTGPAPYAGKAGGELSNVAVPAAIANAVFDAVGVRLTELPVTAEKVYAELQAQEGRKGERYGCGRTASRGSVRSLTTGCWLIFCVTTWVSAELKKAAALACAVPVRCC